MNAPARIACDLIDPDAVRRAALHDTGLHPYDDDDSADGDPVDDARRYDPETFNHAAYHELEPGIPDAARYDGWTPDAQKRFLTALSRGLNVSRACDIVGLSRQSAYAFRGSARGAAFALGWNAAQVRARDVLADELMDRAFNGVRESATTDCGAITTRHRYDNQLAFKMLSRLDKRADAACRETAATAARLAAADFEQLLDLIGRDGGPARAGMFLAARVGEAATAASDDDLAPIRMLVRADRWLRTNTDLGQGIDIADLDPAARAAWTADQWARAEAAGLIQFAPEPAEAAPEPAAQTPQNCQLCQPHAPQDGDDVDDAVWWDRSDEQWKTRFPPDDDFTGYESGRYGDIDYWRELTPGEADAVEAMEQAERDSSLPIDRVVRDNWFADCRADTAARQTPAPDPVTGAEDATNDAPGTATPAHRSPSTASFPASIP